MKKTALILLSGILPILCCLPVSAQNEPNDLGLWTSIEGSTKLAPGVNLSLEAEYRMRDNISVTDRASFGASLSYKNKKLVPWLKANLGYTFIYKNYPAETGIKYELDGTTPKHMNVDDPYWGARHRGAATLSGSWKAGRFKIGLRERYQFTYTAAATCNRVRWYYNPFYEFFPDEVDKWYINDDKNDPDYSYFIDDKNPKYDNKIRSRFDVSYDIRNSKFEPFAEMEMFNDLDRNFAINKIRWTLGTDYKFTKKAKLTLYYRFQDRSDEDEMGGHVIGVGYSFDF